MIRNDSIELFVSHLTQTNLSLSSTIKPSIFETNQFLERKEPSLIEYAAFYGSIQIFQYLRLNNVEMKPSLWIYAIHSQNADLIHLLEENRVNPPSDTFESCFYEAVKCHHNDFANYFKEVKMNDEKSDYKNSFKYCNYQQIPCQMGNNSIFYYLSSYNYPTLVELYLKSREENTIEISI